ncbi:MAG TPA: pitrilysin family protein, partial [Alphaproteobacteria bacterium]|nr:pitrilysin family protein [Alphaproteobacteria bacterium]
EHMAFKGTARRSARAIAEEIEAVGGHLNAYTSREQTCYYARVLRGDLPLAVDLLADIVQHSTFAEEELARERTVVIQEIGQAEDTPDDIVFDHLQDRAFPDQPLGRSILGTVEKVAGMGRQQLHDFMHRHYAGGRLILCAAGAVEHDRLVALAETHFAGLPGGSGADYEAARYGGGPRYTGRELEQLHFTIGFPSLPYADDDFYAAQVAATALGGGMSSRLFQEIRERRGLCYSVFAFNSAYTDGGLFGVYAGTGEEAVEEMVPVICDELLRAADDLAEDELARARAQMKAGTLMALESSTARAEQLARQLMIYGRPVPLAEIVERIDAVDVAAVHRALHRILDGGRPAVAALGPLGRLASYEAIAARFA